MVVGMPRTEAEKEAQHVEGGVCLEVIQNEEKLLPGRVEMAFWPARWNLLDFALPTPFQLDGIVGRREGRKEDVEFWQAHADDGLNLAVMLLAIQLFKSFEGHGLSIFCRVWIPYNKAVLKKLTGSGTSLMYKSAAETHNEIVRRMRQIKQWTAEGSTKELLNVLHTSYDPFFRFVAVDKLRALKDPIALPSLIKTFLYDTNTDVVQQAAKALGHYRDESAIPALLSVLNGTIETTSVPIVIDALAEISGPLAFSGLLETLRTNRSYARFYPQMITAIDQIGIRNTEAVSVLINIIESDDSITKMKAAAVSILGKFEDERVLPLLYMLFTHPDKTIQTAALKAMKDAGVPQTKIDELTQAFESSLDGLIEKLKTASTAKESEAIENLVTFGTAAIPKLTEAVSSPKTSNKLAVRAMIVLDKIGDPNTIPTMLKILRDPTHIWLRNDFDHYALREATVKALGHLKNRDANPALLATLNESYEPPALGWDIQLAIAEALGSIGDTTVVPTLLSLLNTLQEYWLARRTIAKALGDLKDLRARRPLQKLLKNATDDNEKEIIQTALAQIEAAHPELNSSLLARLIGKFSSKKNVLTPGRPE